MFKAFIFLPIYFLATLVSAHSGRTDAYGGHNKYSDGTYHYHNSGTMGNGSGDWSIFTWLIVLFLLYIIGLFIWTCFKDEEDNKTPISNVRREDSNPARATRSSDTKKRGESSTAARADREASSSDAQSRGEKSTAAKSARAASSSDPKSRGQESTAVKAAKAASSTSTNASETEDLYFDNIKGSHKEKPSKDDSNEDNDDDLYFDNRVKK
jgi:cytoskeletal protein RodZ